MTQARGELRSGEEKQGDQVVADTATQAPLWQRRADAATHFFTAHYWIFCLLIGGIALGFNFYRLGTQSMWFDEILSVVRARQPLSVLIQIIFATQPNMAFYYIFMHYWLSFTALLGWLPTEVVVRSPSVVFAAASSVIIFLLGRRFLGLVGGLVAAGLYLLNDLQLLYAQDTRSYALQLLLICMAWYALLTIMTAQSRQKRWWLCFALAMVLAIYSQLFSFLILAAQAATFVGFMFLPNLWRSNVRRQFLNAGITIVGIFVLAIPLIYASRHGSKTGWLPIPHPIDVYQLFLTICANSRIYLYLLLALIVFGLCVAGMTYRVRGKLLLSQLSLLEGDTDSRVAWLQQLWPVAFALLCWLFIPLVLSYGISQGPIRLFSSRYLVTIVPPFLLLVALGIAVLRWRLLQTFVIIGVLLLTLHYVPLYYEQPQIEDWNVTTFWLEQHYQPNDGLVCFDNSQGCQVSVEYYLTAYPSTAHFSSDSPGSFPWVQYDLSNHQGNTELAVNPSALANFGAHHPRVFYITGRLSGNAAVAQAHAAQQWLDAHYHFIAQIATKSVVIRLYRTS